MADELTKVAVIGTGLAGLITLNQLTQSKEPLRLTAFERNYDVGGQWMYTDQTTPNEFGLAVHSAVYRELRANLPLPLMTIAGFPHEDDMPTFLDRTQVLSYLQSFCDKNDLRRYIKFNTVVQRVIQVDSSDRFTKWKVTYHDIRTKDETKTEEFDYILVCTGIFHTPSVPVVKGSDLFEGYITHSLYYRHPEIYRDQKVAILGGSFSAIEISQQIAKFAKRVYVCHRAKQFPSSFPENVIPIKSGFESITPSSVVLQNGEVIEVDSIIYCTGYRINYPFLPDNFIQMEGKRIRNLFKEIVPVQNSTIMFILTTGNIAQFTISTNQAKYARLLIEGSVDFPEIDEMKRVIDDDFNRRELDLHTHLEYATEIATLGNFESYFEKRHEKLTFLFFENFYNKQPIFRQLKYE